MKDPIVYYSDVDYARKDICDRFKDAFATQPGTLTSAALLLPTDTRLDPCVLYGLRGNDVALKLAAHFASHVHIYTLREDETDADAIALRTSHPSVYLNHDVFFGGAIEDMLGGDISVDYTADSPELAAYARLLASVTGQMTHRLAIPGGMSDDEGETYQAPNDDAFAELCATLRYEVDLATLRYEQLDMTPDGVLRFTPRTLPVQP